MALSTRLIRRLDEHDEPLTKRLKLAENVLYSSDTLIFRKEDCIFKWLCNELSDKNDTDVWQTINRCLALDPKNFSRLALTTKNLLIQNLIDILQKYPECKVSKDMVKCCSYIFSGTNNQNYSKEDKIMDLIEVLLVFIVKVLNSNEDDKCVDINLVLECAQCAISTFSQNCRQSFSEKKNFIIIFIEKLLFPLSSLIKTIRDNKISSKIVIETQKCIKRLLLGSIKNVVQSSEEEKINEETEILFDSLKHKVSSTELEDGKIAFTFLFECVVNIFQQNSKLIDIVLRKLVNCIEQKEQAKQVLTALIESSIDVSYNFDNEIDGVSLKAFLKTYIEEVISKKKRLKCSDYELLSAVAKLNPLIVEDITQNILERILFENLKDEKEEIARDILLKELWRTSVRLRRQQKFLSKFLLTIRNSKEKNIKNIELINEFELPKHFISEFTEDLKSKMTSAQIIAIFHTLIYHLKSDCIDNIQNSVPASQECLIMKIVARFFVIFFEHSNFLDTSLPHDWQMKFYQTFSDLRNSLATFIESICRTPDNFHATMFIAFSNIIKIWCEVYDLLRYYLSNDVVHELSFPIDESQWKELKQIVKKYGDQSCKESLNQLLVYEMAVYNRDNKQSINNKIVKQLWSTILENHFEIIESLSDEQILELTSCLVNEACNSQNALSKWTLFFKNNTCRLTKKFTTATALQIISNISSNFEKSSTNNIIEKIDFIHVLKSLEDSNNLKGVLKNARKEFSKQNFFFLPLTNEDLDSVKRNFIFLSTLPLSFLDVDIRIILFMFLYTFEEETKNISDCFFNAASRSDHFKECTVNLYLDFIRQNDINIFDHVSQPTFLINHFKNDRSILLKICKSSFTSDSTVKFWKQYITTEECDKKISSILLICIDSLKNKTSSEHKNVLQNLSLKLSNNITKGLYEEMNDSDEIAGLRISLKIILSEKKKLKDKVKNCVDKIVKNIIENIENESNDKLIHEILQLSSIILLHREIFSVDEEITKKLCIILIKNPDGKILSHFLECLKDNEFDFFSKCLTNQTKEILINGDVQALEKILIVWEYLSKAEAKVARSKSLKSSVINHFNDLLSSEISETSFPYLLKICRNIVTSKRMIRLSEDIIDSIFVISTQCLSKLNKDKLTTCQEALGLCLDFLRSKAEFLPDRLFALTDLFCKTIRVILQEAKDTAFSDEQILRILAVDIEKFCTFFAKLKKDVARISSYLIADIIDISSRTGVLPTYLKTTIDSSISHILSNCDQYAISFLSRTLPASTQQVFKTIYDNYTKYHKFTGKI